MKTLTGLPVRIDSQAATPTAVPLGEIRLRHVVATGAGQADIDAARLAFAKGDARPWPVLMVRPLSGVRLGCQGGRKTFDCAETP